MKKILVCALTAVLTLSMFTGCGTKKENEVTISMNEVIEKTLDSIADLQSAELDLTANADVEIDYNGERGMSVVGEIKGGLETNLEEPSLHLNGLLKYEAKIDANGIKNTSSAEEKLEIYGEKNENQLALYGRWNDDEWEKDVEEIEEINELIEGIRDLKEIDNEDLKELNESGAMEFAKLESKTKVVNDKECYVIKYELNREELIKLLKIEELSDEKSVKIEEAKEEAVEALKEFSTLLEIYIDVKTYLPVKAALGIELDAELDMAGTQIKFNELNLEMNLKTNQTKPIKVPSDIKETAVEME